MKNRFNAVDVAAIIHDLKKNAVGKRVVNVYDINGKTYLLKLSGASQGKSMVLIESGIRIHMTNHNWSKPDLPNGFAMKLRKHLRGALLFAVSMLVTGCCLERVLNFDFGKYRLLIELYDHGNILLTTDEYIVVYALRPRPAIGQQYPFEAVKNCDTTQSFLSTVEQELSKVVGEDGVSCDEREQLRRWLSRITSKRFGGATVLIEHALALNGLNGKKSLRDCLKEYGGLTTFLPALTKALEISNNFISSLISSAKPGVGPLDIELPVPVMPCITSANLRTKSAEGSAVFDEFFPFTFQHINESKDPSLIQHFETFSEAVDEFFWKQEDSKLKVKEAADRDAAFRRVENVRRDHDARIKQLQNEADATSQAATFLEQNLSVVERALSTVRTAVNSSLSQADIEQLLLEARNMGDPTASYIYKLNVDKGSMKLRFNTAIVEVELGLNGIQNTEKLWSKRRSAMEKLTKTVAAAQIAIKNAERSIGSSVSKSIGELDERARSTRSQRRPFWFEQFAWFVSSDGRLVIAGRDHQQNELLVRRYMAATDIFIHCELHGAGVVLIKTGLESSKSDEKPPPPPSTLREAAIFAVARSVAWQQGTPAHAYWVWGNQVSKTPQPGEFITPGAFIIRGKRNMLPLEPLVLGLSVVFVAATTSTEDDAGSNDEESGSEDEQPKSGVAEHSKSTVKAEAVHAVEKEAETGNKVGEEEEEIKVKDEKAKESFDVDEGDLWAGVGATTPSSNAVSPSEPEPVVVVSLGPVSKGKHQQNQSNKKNAPPELVIPERPVSAPSSSKQKQPTRGQKGKLKKMKEKYGDQDEEERAARMALLQSAGSKQDKSKKKKGSAKVPQPKSAPVKPALSERQQFPPKAPKKQEPQNALGMGDEGEDEVDVQNRLNKQRIVVDQALHRFVADPLRKSPLVRFFQLHPSVESLPEEQQDSLKDKPLLFALPMCAPYPSLTRCAFKVKIIPGKTKRGKVARAAIEAWQRQLASERSQRSTGEETASTDQRQQPSAIVRALVKAVGDEEWSRNMPQSCKLMLSGAAQAAATERMRKKQQAKKQKQAAAIAAKQ